jgi:hypothetical protein
MICSPPSCSMGDTGADRGHRRSPECLTVVRALSRQPTPPSHHRRDSMVSPLCRQLAQQVLGRPLVLPVKTTWHTDHRLATGARATMALPSEVTALWRAHATPKDMGCLSWFSSQAGPAVVGFHNLLAWCTPRAMGRFEAQHCARVLIPFKLF